MDSSRSGIRRRIWECWPRCSPYSNSAPQAFRMPRSIGGSKIRFRRIFYLLGLSALRKPLQVSGTSEAAVEELSDLASSSDSSVSGYAIVMQIGVDDRGLSWGKIGLTRAHDVPKVSISDERR